MGEQERESDIGRAPPPEPTKFDLDLFLQLNEEYRDKPVYVTHRFLDTGSRAAFAERRATVLEERMGVRGTRVLEVGCGDGDVAAVLARDYGCEVIGVDMKEHATWAESVHPRLTLRTVDITKKHDLDPESFDRIVSFVVWEHMQHPYAGLRACRDLLRPDGRFYLCANLYPSPIASHRYREVFFPWPHLLFSDDVFAEFYQHLGRRPKWSSWVNRLTYAHYLQMFDMLGFSVEQEWLSRSPLDKDFYIRYYDVLSRYPGFDLTLKFFDVILAKGSKEASEPLAPSPQLGRRYVRELASHEQKEADQAATIARQEGKLASHKRKEADQAATIERQEDELAALNWQVAEETAERERLQQRNREYREEMAAKESEVAQLKGELSAMESEMSLLEAKQTAERERAQQRDREYQEELSAKESEMSLLEAKQTAERERAQQRDREYQEELSAKESEMSPLEARVVETARNVPAWVPSPQSAEEALRSLDSLLKRRSYRLAKRLSKQPRDFNYWLTLPLDILRVILNHDMESNGTA